MLEQNLLFELNLAAEPAIPKGSLFVLQRSLKFMLKRFYPMYQILLGLDQGATILCNLRHRDHRAQRLLTRCRSVFFATRLVTLASWKCTVKPLRFSAFSCKVY